MEFVVMSLVYAALPYRAIEDDVTPAETNYYRWLHSLPFGSELYGRAYGAFASVSVAPWDGT